MPKSIVAHLNKKLKNLSKILTIPRFWGPLATITFTALYHYGAQVFGYSVTVMPLVCFLVAGSFIGGLRAGLICAAWISLYAFYATPGDISRTVQVAIGSFGIAAVVGWQTRRLRTIYKAADELLNGNTSRLNEALQSLRVAKEGLSQARRMIEKSEDGFGNVLAGVVGYRQIRETMREVNEWYADPENIHRLQEMEAAKEEDEP